VPLKTAILGVGLIGGSIGLALREKGWPVTGWGPGGNTLRLAVERGAIERASATADEAIEQAELVVLAGPIRTIPDALRWVARAARPGTVVTDVASVKGQVLRWAGELLPPGVHFVGGHPMAGKEQQGIAAADARLLEGCTYCLTPASSGGLPAVRQLVNAVGGRELVIDAEAHDRAVAAASHLPFVAATALVRTVASPLQGLAGEVASSGFRDTSRVAMASPVMHADVCNFNAEAIAGLIDRLQSELELMKTRLREPSIESTFREAAAIRDRWAQIHDGRATASTAGGANARD
jgi:prephenate dehydrogenase